MATGFLAYSLFYYEFKNLRGLKFDWNNRTLGLIRPHLQKDNFLGHRLGRGRMQLDDSFFMFNKRYKTSHIHDLLHFYDIVIKALLKCNHIWFYYTKCTKIKNVTPTWIYIDNVFTYMCYKGSLVSRSHGIFTLVANNILTLTMSLFLKGPIISFNYVVPAQGKRPCERI